jgi:hypothetical protein
MGWGSFGDFLKDALNPIRVMHEEGMVQPVKDLLSGHIPGTTIANFLTAGGYSMVKSSFATWGSFTKRLAEIPEAPSADTQQDISVNKTSNVTKLPVIYGERGKVGGNLSYINTSGSNNEYLWIRLDICEGEIEAIDTVYIDDTPSTDSKFSGLVSIWKHTGTDTQAADPNLVAEFPEYTSAHQCKGVAYVVLRLKFKQEAFSGFPRITCDIRGKKVYDPRTGTTAYSTTPALCLRDFLVNNRYGKGLDASLIDDESIKAVADLQEVQVQQHQNTTNTFPLLTCNLYLDTGRKIIDNLRILLSANRAWLPRYEGKYHLVFEQDEPSVFSFNVDNIIGGWAFSQGEMNSRLNQAEVTFTNKNLEWKDDTVQVVSDTLVAQDKNWTLSTSIPAPWITDPYHATDLANIAIKKSRQQLAVQFVASPEALNVVPGSVVDVTHDTPGWTNKKFRVVDITLMPMGLVGVSLVEHEATVYDRDVPVEAPTPPDTNLPDPNTVIAPSNLHLFSGTSVLLVAQDGTVISRIKATWDPPAGYPYVLGYDLEYKKSADSEWIPAPMVLASSGTAGYIGPVDDGVYYDVRVRTSGPGGRKSDWVYAYNHLVIGKTEPPPPVDTFLVDRQPDGTRQFSWTMNNPPADLAGYRIKYRLSAGQAWEDLLPLHEGLLTASPYETNLLAAGTYTVGIVAVDTSGNESTPVLIDSTLGDPRIKGAVYTTSREAEDPPWPGTITNGWVDPNTHWIIAEDTKTWADFATDGVTWGGWTAWARAPQSQIIYEDVEIDLGTAVKFNPLVTLTGDGTFTIEERHSEDGTNWTSYAPIGPLVTAQKIQFRVTVDSVGSLGILKSMQIVLSADPVDEYLNDIVMSNFSSSPGVLRLPIKRTYVTITQVTLALQSTTGGWTWRLVDKDPTLGPLVNVYDQNGNLADTTIDAVVRGIR